MSHSNGADGHWEKVFADTHRGILGDGAPKPLRYVPELHLTQRVVYALGVVGGGAVHAHVHQYTRGQSIAVHDPHNAGDKADKANSQALPEEGQRGRRRRGGRSGMIQERS
jgi:hypothetical protein